MARTRTTCANCHYRSTRVNFCPQCGADFRVMEVMQASMKVPEVINELALFEEMILMDETEIVSVVRRPDGGQEITIEADGVDPDVAIALLLKGLVVAVMQDIDLEVTVPDDDEDEDDIEG